MKTEMMTSRLIAVFVSLTMSFYLSVANAELFVHETFDYSLGEIDGQEGGTGFSGPWVAETENAFALTVADPGTPMSYTIPGGGTINGGNRVLRLANEEDFVIENDTEILFRDFDATIDTDDIYISYLYRYVAGEIDDNDFVIWWYNDQGGPNIGLKGNLGNGSGVEDLMSRMACCGPPQQEYAPDIDISEEEGTIGQDFFIVGRLSRAGNSDDPDDYDQYDLWVNPAQGDVDNPLSSGIANPEDFFLTELFAIGMRAFSQEPEDEMIWDELRIGSTWEDVVSGNNADPLLQAGDADQDLDFDQLDLVKVQIGGKYLTGQAATWGDGDWDGAPGGKQGEPPAGNGFFDQLDIISALNAGVYLTGPYAAIQPGGVEGDGQTSVVYDPGSGELSVDPAAGNELTSINITSAGSKFVGDKPAALDGAFDNFAADNVFKATFGGSFGNISFGNVLAAGIPEAELAADLTVVGSLAGGGDLGDVDLVYLPEPSSMLLGLLGAMIFASRIRGRRRPN